MIQVEDLKEKANMPPNRPGVYKWWCDGKTFSEFIEQINEIARQTNEPTCCLFNVIESQVEKKETQCGTLFCIYVGKANEKHGLHDRILSNHIHGNVNASTLRKTVFSLEYGVYNKSDSVHKQLNKEYVQDVINGLWVEWTVCASNQEVHTMEIEEINAYLRIFNLDKGDLCDTIFENRGHDANCRKQILKQISYARNKFYK